MRFKNFSKLFILPILALLTSVPAFADDSTPLPQNSGKVAFLKSHLEDGVSSLELPALNFFIEEIGAEKDVINTSETSRIQASDYDCIWIHIDRYDLGDKGYMKLPREFTTTKVISALKQYIDDGGNLLLTGHATQLLVAINRIDGRFAPNEVAWGTGGDNTDDWTVNPVLNQLYDHNNHAIYNNLAVSHFFLDHDTYGLQYADGTDLHRDDHNCMWNLTGINLDGADGDRIQKFETLTYSSVLGTWGQSTGDENAGIVEFYPLKYENSDKYQGTIIAIGLAAYSWNDLGKNTNADNLKRLTANTIAYLADPNGVKPYNPDPYTGWLLKAPELPEILESTGKVGLYVGYTRDEFGNEEDYDLNDSNYDTDYVMNREKTLCGNFEEKAVYDWFVKTYGEEKVIFADELDKISKKKFDCIWVHASRTSHNDENGLKGYEYLPDVFKLKDQFTAYINDGGNLFLSLHAVQILEGMGRAPKVDECVTQYKSEKSNNDSWDMKLTHYGNDWSSHVLFQNFINDIDHAYDYDNNIIDYNSKVIRLMSGLQNRRDFNCLWKINEANQGLKEEFCRNYNCEILGTWGHTNGEDGAGFVIFYPKKNEAANSKQHRITVADDIVNRRGTIIANGLAAYQWHVSQGENGSQDYVEKLTNSVLQYLSPVVNEETIPDVDYFKAIASEYKVRHIKTKGYVVDNEETGEGHHTYSEYDIDDYLKLDPTLVQNIEVTPVKDPVWLSNHDWDQAIALHGDTPETHAYYHGWYFGEPTAKVDENGHILLYANLPGVYKVALTTIYGNTYNTEVTVMPWLDDSNISFDHMDNITGQKVTFGDNLAQNNRDKIQLYTNYWGPVYYVIEYNESKMAKIMRISEEEDGDSETETLPVHTDGTVLKNKSATNKFNLSNATSMIMAQKVNGLMTNTHQVSFESIPTSVSEISVSNSPVRFFTLDGIEVSFPTHAGIYIKVSNGVATKLVIR